MTLNPNGLYSIDEVATMLDVHPRTIMRRLKARELVGKKVGNNWIILGINVVDYLSGDPQIECQMLEDELAFYDPRFKGTKVAYETMVRNAPNRASVVLQLANFMKSVRESSLNK